MTQSGFETVIGLEVHAQLLSRTKLFCGCSTSFGAPPNTQVCPVCLGLPGALPVPNERALELAMRAGLAFHCTIRGESRFARKNYFYPDLAKGYQISQYELPLNEMGYLDIDIDGTSLRVNIQRIHVEEDAAKNIHGAGQAGVSLIDFNRAGVPLIEIVSAPDLRNAAQAESYLKRVREVLMFAGVNDGNLEEGSFRCDANVSVMPQGSSTFGTRVELKNINSFRFVRKAIDYEAARQKALIGSGGKVLQETRTWSETEGKTILMRSKEEAHDYRYFPDPDLPTLRYGEDAINAVRQSLPELPDAKRQRWQTELGLTAYDSQVLTGHPEIANYVESVAQFFASQTGKIKPDKDIGKRTANFVQSEILRHVNADGLTVTFPVEAQSLAELLAMVGKNEISGKMAKDVLADMISTGHSAKKIVEDKGLRQLTDTGAIEAAIREILSANQGEVEKYKAGKTNVFGFFVGQVMRATKGSANPAAVNETLKKLLDS